MLVLGSLPPFYSVQDPVDGMALPTSGVGPPFLAQPLWKNSQTHTYRCVSMVTPNPMGRDEPSQVPGLWKMLAVVEGSSWHLR